MIPAGSGVAPSLTQYQEISFPAGHAAKLVFFMLPIFRAFF
jgi:hypothetical protein